MNYLAHVLLAGSDPELRLGNFLGDFVTGSLAGLRGHYPEAVITGIGQHRRLDHFTDTHPVFNASRGRIDPGRRRVAGVIVDVGYDHFLTRHWPQFSDQPLPEFIDAFHGLLEARSDLLPARLRALLPRLVRENWLGSYGDLPGLGRTFTRMSGRLRRPELLLGAEAEIARSYEALEGEFHGFFAAARRFVEEGWQ